MSGQVITLYDIRKYFLVFNIFYKQLAKNDAIRNYDTVTIASIQLYYIVILHANLISAEWLGQKSPESN